MKLEISREDVLSLVQNLLRDEIAKMRPLLREELLRSCEMVDEEGGIAMLPIGGKDPRRTFRRLMNKHQVEYVVIDSFKWWKRSAIEKLIDKHTVHGKRESRIENREPQSELKAVA